MAITIENTSSKALRLRYFDKANKSKAIIDVYWSQLGGNKYPYLSTNIVAIKKQGVKLPEVVENLKDVNKDFYSIIKSHLACAGSGALMHEVANSWYHIQECKKSLLNTPTKGEIQKQIEAIKNGLMDDNMITKGSGKLTLFSVINKSLSVNQKESFYKALNKYYKDQYVSDRQLTKFKEWVLRSVTSGRTSTQTISKYLDNNLINCLKKVKALESKKSKALNDNQLMTFDKLCKCVNLDADVLQSLVLNRDLKQSDLEAILNVKISNRGYSLQELTNKYKIPLVISK